MQHMYKTTFVYHDEGGFLLHFSRKTSKIKQNRALERSIAFYGVRYFAFKV